jgi:hypothetical protein
MAELFERIRIPLDPASFSQEPFRDAPSVRGFSDWLRMSF